MAGCQVLRTRDLRFAVALAMAPLLGAGLARAQAPMPPVATPAGDVSEFVDAGAPPMVAPIPTGIPRPGYYPRATPTPTRVVSGPVQTAVDSIFGKPDPDTWRP